MTEVEAAGRKLGCSEDVSVYTLAMLGLDGKLAAYFDAQGQFVSARGHAMGLWVNVNDLGATGDGETDDTAAIQAALDTKKNVWFPPGNYIVSDWLDLTTIGQRVEGAQIGCPTAGVTITQATSAKGTFRFLSTPDVQVPGGDALSYFQIRGFRLITSAASNPSACVVIGDNSDDVGGAYFDLDDLFIAGFRIGIDFAFAGICRCKNISIDGQGEEVSGCKGVRIQDGSQPNSMIWLGLSIGHCQIGLSIEGPSFGGVYFLGDFGINGIHVQMASGSTGVFIGGNFESYEVHAFDIKPNASATIIGTFINAPGVSEPPYNVNFSGQLVRIQTGEGVQAGTPAVTGAGYFNTVCLASLDTIVNVTDGSALTWVDGPVRSGLRALLGHEDYFPIDTDHYGTEVQVIRDVSGNGGRGRVSKTAGGVAFFEWMSSDTAPVADGTYSPTSITVKDGKITAISES